MLFNSREFGLFLAICLAAYAMVGRLPGEHARTGRRTVLLAFSLFFYAYWHPPYLALLLACLVANWLTALWLDRLRHRSRAAWWLLAANVAFNLGVLGLYKYSGFVLRTVNWAGAGLGIRGHVPVIDFILPLGISFFTFQMLAYSVDVYRAGRIDPQARSFAGYTAFITYFPQLIAGPIMRGSEMLPQIEDPGRITVDGVYWGLMYFAWGLTKKVLISDRLAPFVNLVYANPEGLHWVGQWLAIYCFAFQIYCDFSAYSDMAVGLGRMMGFQIPLNFKEPYLSPNITVFWRRWHITLSSWLRDYLYIPLGGNRGGEARTYRNLMLTMLLGGLWHGAGWVYVVWGFMHGAYLAGHKLWTTWRQNQRTDLELASAADRQAERAGAGGEVAGDPWRSVGYWVGCLVTFHLVCLTWIFFRAGLNDPKTAMHTAWNTSLIVLKSIFTFQGHAQGAHFWAQGYQVIPFLVLAALLHVAERVVRHHRAALAQSLWERVPPLGQAAGLATVLAGLLLLGGEQVQFIYFAF